MKRLCFGAFARSCSRQGRPRTIQHSPPSSDQEDEDDDKDEDEDDVEKAADAADTSVLFFSAGANFYAQSVENYA